MKSLFKVLVAPASYKGSIAASRLAAAIGQSCRDFAANLEDLDIEILEVPIADGGDDTVESLHSALGGNLIRKVVVGPVDRPVEATYLRVGDRAIVELANASGIAYLSALTLAPLTAHTYGTGEVIADAIAGGASDVTITVGGSASTDGGTAALAALGAKFLDKSGQPLAYGGGDLFRLAKIDVLHLQALTRGVRFTVATDVTSPLLGDSGAAAIFGPQKGADAGQVQILDQGLARLAEVIELSQGQSADRRLDPGAGAAGGAGFGFASLLQARIVSGFHFFAELTAMREKIAWCDLLIVAEGKLDRQSVTGKGVGEIIALAVAEGKRVLALPAISDLSDAELTEIFRPYAAEQNQLQIQIQIFPTAEHAPAGIAQLPDVRATVHRALDVLLK